MNMKLEAKAISKTFQEGACLLQVLQEVSFACESGEKIGIVGASGSGKSTLLHILGGLESPNSGSVWVGNENLYELSESERATHRNRLFGFVFQFYHLITELTAVENVMLPFLIAGEGKQKARSASELLLEQVGLQSAAKRCPTELSGGEQQRVAIARAIAINPSFLFADEPTGNLDAATGESVFQLLLGLPSQNRGLILVTHNHQLLSSMDRSYELKEGRLFPL